MNFQLKLYQLIKTRLRDQKYEISSRSSLLSFWIWLVLWETACGQVLFPFLWETFTACKAYKFYWKTGLGRFVTPIIYLRNRKLGAGCGWSQRTLGWELYLQGTESRVVIQGNFILVQPNMGNTPIGCWIFLCQTSHLSLFPTPVSLIQSPRILSRGVFIFLFFF